MKTAPVTLRTKSPSLMSRILKTPAYARVEALLAGYELGHDGRPLPDTLRSLVAQVRASQGFKASYMPVLTPPDANTKLAKGITPSYGLTLAHADLSGWEACPWRGACTAVCVLTNGNGRYDSTQRAWIWRTLLVADHTTAALTVIGHELGKAVRKDGPIMWRPNVNSDLLWHRILPAIRWPEIQVTPYGYTKNPAVLSTSGWIDGFRYAYSVNETTKLDRLADHLTAGGAVAVVTNRKPNTPTQPDKLRTLLTSPTSSVLDADKSDLWMMTPNTIGDLAAKGKARTHGGRFIRTLEG
jgi:hypothetical protein